MTRKPMLLLGAALATGLLYTLYRALSYSGVKNFETSHELHARQGQISEAFQHAWDGYARYCFGHDSLKPVSNGCIDDFGGWGASAIDALSTAIIMGKEDVVLRILGFIATLDMSVVVGGTKVQVFEVTIRNFGGMISAWDMLNGPSSAIAQDQHLRQALYRQMIHLGDILSCSFDPGSGIPHDWVEASSCQADAGTSSSIAGVGTMILEFARLSAITGNHTYRLLAERAEEYVLTPDGGEPFPGLLGSFIEMSSGKFLDSRGSWGAFDDSFYEYLIKAYVYDSEKYAFYRDRWLLAADSTIKYIGSHPYGHPEWTLLSTWDGTQTTNKIETLSWFAGGNFILGGMVLDNQTLIDYGISIADAAGQAYRITQIGLAGEFVTWTTNCEDEGCNADNSMTTTDGRYELRPEVLETWYHAYRATKNPKYRQWAWDAFEAINQYCRTDSGFSAISNVNNPDNVGQTDKQESFIYAEVLKYLYLIHLEDHETPYHIQDSRKGRKNEWVYNTEAHPLRVKGTPV